MAAARIIARFESKLDLLCSELRLQNRLISLGLTMLALGLTAIGILIAFHTQG